MTSVKVLLTWLAFSLALAGCSCGATRLRTVEDLDAGTCLDTGTCCTPAPETCNGRDDDCDGAIDEELPPISCGIGACARSVPSCVSGAPFDCTPLAPSPEVCNGLDDDCNGATDEGLMPQTCGVGECAAVEPSCVAGAPAACQPTQGNPEQCNGLDDDCDGTVDEGLVTNTTGDVRITNNPASSDFVYLGRGGSGFGMVWQDERDGANGQIYFAGLTPQGARVNAQDTRVSNTANASTHPALAWTGQAWGLVYADGAAGSLELWYRPLASNGQPTAAATRLTNATGDSDWPDVVWTGQHFAVAYDDERNGNNKHDVYFQRFGVDGARVGNEVRVTTDGERQSSPILKWNGTGFGLAWTDYRHGSGNREVYFRRLAADGTPQGNEVRLTNNAADSAWPDLAWNDAAREWAVVWHDSRDGNAEVYFARLSATGTKLGAELRLTTAAGFSGYPSIDWNGFQYGVSWQDERAGAGRGVIYFAPVSAMGQKTATEFALSSGAGNSTFTTALWNGATFAFGWRDDRNGPAGNTELYFALVGCPN